MFLARWRARVFRGVELDAVFRSALLRSTPRDPFLPQEKKNQLLKGPVYLYIIFSRPSREETHSGDEPKSRLWRFGQGMAVILNYTVNAVRNSGNIAERKVHRLSVK